MEHYKSGIYKGIVPEYYGQPVHIHNTKTGLVAFFKRNQGEDDGFYKVDVDHHWVQCFVD